jgi:hypothetical protein
LLFKKRLLAAAVLLALCLIPLGKPFAIGINRIGLPPIKWEHHAGAAHSRSFAVQGTPLPILLLLLLNSTEEKWDGGVTKISLFDMFVVCRNIFHKTKYREKTFKSHVCLIAIFY